MWRRLSSPIRPSVLLRARKVAKRLQLVVMEDVITAMTSRAMVSTMFSLMVTRTRMSRASERIAAPLKMSFMRSGP